MKKMKTLVLGVVGISCLALAPTFLSKPAQANEQVLENITWNNNDLYVTETVVDETPKTVEAWLQVSPTQIKKAGTIFGNTGANQPFNSASRYEIESKDAFSVEIDTKGNPRLYCETPYGEVESVIFRNVDVRSDELVHLTITRDDEFAYCYLNGVLKETAEFVIDDYVSIYPYAVGGDYTHSRENYFKGVIESVSVYSNTRTQAEVSADIGGVDAQDEDLMFAYDLKGKAGADEIVDISANKNNLIREWRWADEVEIPQYAYSMIAVGDTQYSNWYHQSDKINFNSIYEHIKTNASNQKLKFVFGLGDITDQSKEGEFSTAKENWQKLDGVVPYSLVRGNHDTVEGFVSTWGGEQSTYSKQYFDAYDPATALTTAHKFSVGKLDYLVLALSWAPSTEEIAWASEVVAAHPYHNVIVTTHGFMDANGEVLEYWSDKGKNYADRIWDNLIKKHDNIVLVMSGHIYSQKIEMKQVTGEKGNTITQLLIDPSWLDEETASSGGTGLLANLYFSEDGSQVSVNWYSPIRNQYYNCHSVYSFEIETVARKQVNVSVKGNGGSATPNVTEVSGEPITVTFTPESEYRLSKLTLDGVDVTESVVNNVYTFTNTDGNLNLVAEFAPILYKVSVENADEKGIVSLPLGVDEYKKGTEISVEVIAKSGYSIKSVSFNGEVLESNENGKYVATVADKTNVLAVEYEEVEAVPAPTNENEKKNNVGKTIGFFAIGLVGSLAIGAGIALLIRKREM